MGVYITLTIYYSFLYDPSLSLWACLLLTKYIMVIQVVYKDPHNMNIVCYIANSKTVI